jgi:hypothetical protein
VYIEFDFLEVKVPVIFLGTEGFSLRREGRYLRISKRLWLIMLSRVLLPPPIITSAITPYFTATTKLF